MGKSKKIRRGGGQGLFGVARMLDLATGLPLSQVPTAALNATASTIDVVDHTAKTVTEGLKVGQEGLKVGQEFAKLGQNAFILGQQVTESTKNITDETGRAAVESLKSLTTQIGNASDNVTELSNLSKESLNKLAPGISTSVGNIGSLTALLTKSIIDTVTSGGELVSSILSVVTLPFVSIKAKIEKMKEVKSDASQKNANFVLIKTEIKTQFNKISVNTKHNFELQLNKILSSIEKFIKVLSDTCSNSWFIKNCNKETNTLIAKIKSIQSNLEVEKDSFITREIDVVLSLFDTKIDAITMDSTDNYLDLLYNNASAIQSMMLNSLMTKLTEQIIKFNEVINSIQSDIHTFSTTVQPSNGGRKTNKRKTKKSKSKKSKTRKSKK